MIKNMKVVGVSVAPSKCNRRACVTIPHTADVNSSTPLFAGGFTCTHSVTSTGPIALVGLLTAAHGRRRCSG